MPPDAVTVTVAVPFVAVDDPFNVIVLLPLPGAAIDVGANVAVTPFGRPLADSVTAAANPLLPVVATVNGIDPFRAIDTAAPLSDTARSGPFTDRLTV